MIGNNPGELQAACVINTATDAVSAQLGIASVAVTTTKRKYRVTLTERAAAASNAQQPLGTIQCASGTPRACLVLFISEGVYDIEVVDFTGAPADGSTLLGFSVWRTQSQN